MGAVVHLNRIGPVSIYNNFMPFRARCGTTFALDNPQQLPKTLADQLPCTVCVKPKVNYVLTPCLEIISERIARTTQWPEFVFIEATESTVDGIDAGTVVPMKWEDATSGSLSSAQCYGYWKTTGDYDWFGATVPFMTSCGPLLDGYLMCKPPALPANSVTCVEEGSKLAFNISVKALSSGFPGNVTCDAMSSDFIVFVHDDATTNGTFDLSDAEMDPINKELTGEIHCCSGGTLSKLGDITFRVYE